MSREADPVTDADATVSRSEDARAVDAGPPVSALPSRAWQSAGHICASDRAWHPFIAVPARNEAARLPRLIAALAAQSWCRGSTVPLDVVLVLNNCSDGSREIAESESRKHPAIRLQPVSVDFAPGEAHVGSARRLAFETARALCPASGRAALLTTDADAAPAPNWVEANLAAIARGADLVGGRIVGNSAEEALLGPAFRRRARDHEQYADLCDRLIALVDPVAYDPWPRHHDHTGASLAVRADVHDLLGGLPALPHREDLAFVSNARAAGFKLRHAPEVVVEVSARTAGRASGGMADCLKRWVTEAEIGRPHLVEAPAEILDRAKRRRLVRTLAPSDPTSIAVIATGLSLLPADLHDPAGRPLSSAQLIERFVPDEPDARRTAPIDSATRELENLIANQVGASYAA